MKLLKIKNGDKLSSESIDERYSKEEKMIGTWVNGKPLYRRVFEGIFNNELGGKGFEVNLTSSNIEEIFMHGTIEYIDNYGSGKHNLGGYLTSDFYSGIQINSAKRLSVWASKKYHNGAIKIIVFYTKTTD